MINDYRKMVLTLSVEASYHFHVMPNNHFFYPKPPS